MNTDSKALASKSPDSKIPDLKIPAFNRQGVLAIYSFEMARFRRTFWQSLATPVLTTVLFLVVFGAAIGRRMGEVNEVSYGAFIVPGLIMLSLFTKSLNNASFGIHIPKFTGTIYEILSAPARSACRLRQMRAMVGKDSPWA